MEEQKKMLLQRAYALIVNYTDDMGWCNVCDKAEHASDCEQQAVLNEMRKLFPEIFID